MNKRNITPEQMTDFNVPMGKTLGIVFLKIDEDYVEAEMLVKGDFATMAFANAPDGTLHGGAFMSFADNVGATGAFCDLESHQGTTTSESKTNFFRPIPVGEKAIAKSIPLHKGKRTQIWQTRIENEAGKLCAIVTQTQMILE